MSVFREGEAMLFTEGDDLHLRDALLYYYIGETKSTWVNFIEELT